MVNRGVVRTHRRWMSPGQTLRIGKLKSDAVMENAEWAKNVLSNGAGQIPPSERTPEQRAVVAEAEERLRDWERQKKKPTFQAAIIRDVQRDRGMTL